MIETKVALVTGGSRGIGRATCVELARAGYAVIVNYRQNLGAAEETMALVEAEGVPVDVCQADVAVTPHQELLVSYAMERFGRIDFLVNCAGIGPSVRKDILETEEKTFDRVLATNLRGPYFLTQRVARVMIERIKEQSIEGGAIINMSSIRSYTVAPNYGSYCVSKAGLSMVTKLFANRLAEFGINVYEISPSIIATDMTSSETVRKYYDEKFESGLQPINRWGQPEDVAKAVGAVARGYFPFTTGACFHVDGGFHIRVL